MAEWFVLNALALVLALLLDALFGEPNWLWRHVPHPVVLIGKLIGWLDRRMNRQTHTPFRQLRAGITALIRVIFVVAAVSVGLVALAFWIHPALGVGVQVVIGAVFLAQRSLYDHVAAVHTPLSQGDIPAARQALSMIVGRQTATLDEEGIARAALESLAENHSDGVIAPAFWFLIGGAPGIALYKAINTADSMIGHRNERYRQFGWASARLDDVVNWLPARLSVALIALGAMAKAMPLPRWAVIARDAPTHASPNAGWPEASYASVLGVALGGPRVYPDHTVDAPYINAEGRKALTADDIAAGLAMFRSTCMATILAVAALALIVLWPW